MKKSVLIAGGVLLVVILAVLAFLASRSEKPVVTDTPPVVSRGDNDDNNNDDKEVVSTSDVSEPVTPPPAPTVEDVAEAVFGNDLKAEYKFFTEPQKEELEGTSISRSDPQPKEEKIYQVSWKSDGFSSTISSLPETLPVYLLARPLNKTMFEVVKDLRDALGLSGYVLRMNEQSYDVVNVKTGEFFLDYNIYHLFFTASNLKLSGTPASSAEEVEKALSSLGLLGFPYSVETFDQGDGEIWYRFQPNLSLPVFSLDKSFQETSGFTPGKMGAVDIRVNDGTITALYSNFPNITEQGVLPAKSVEDIETLLKAGTFTIGNVELQYPGAISIEDRRKFYDIARGENVPVSDAELTDFKCGYLMEGDSAPQALLSPTCLARGKGMVDGHSVLFEMILPAVGEGM